MSVRKSTKKLTTPSGSSRDVVASSRTGKGAPTKSSRRQPGGAASPLASALESIGESEQSSEEKNRKSKKNLTIRTGASNRNLQVSGSKQSFAPITVIQPKDSSHASLDLVNNDPTTPKESIQTPQSHLEYGPCKHEECQFDPAVLEGYLPLQEADEYIANILLDHFEEYKEEMN